jgi:hypothetical protein
VLAPDDPEEARVSAVRLLCATLLALALFAPAALAQAPRVEGPIPATAHPGDP